MARDVIDIDDLVEIEALVSNIEEFVECAEIAMGRAAQNAEVLRHKLAALNVIYQTRSPAS